jgi:hypothetical protein
VLVLVLFQMFPCVKSSSHAVPGSQQLCASECNRYKGALDVFNKVIRQVSELIRLLFLKYFFLKIY